MKRFSPFLACLFFFLALTHPLRAEPVYFLSLAQVLKESDADYETSYARAEELRKHHKIETLARLNVLGGDSRDLPEFDVPHDIALLRTDTLEAYQAYLTDPKYKTVTKNLLKTVSSFAVLEGRSNAQTQTQIITPMAVVSLIAKEDANPAPHVALVLKVQNSVSLKGNSSAFLKQISTIHISPFNGDDLPSDLIAGKEANTYFIAEFVR